MTPSVLIAGVAAAAVAGLAQATAATRGGAAVSTTTSRLGKTNGKDLHDFGAPRYVLSRAGRRSSAERSE